MGNNAGRMNSGNDASRLSVGDMFDVEGIPVVVFEELGFFKLVPGGKEPFEARRVFDSGAAVSAEEFSSVKDAYFRLAAASQARS